MQIRNLCQFTIIYEVVLSEHNGHLTICFRLNYVYSEKNFKPVHNLVIIELNSENYHITVRFFVINALYFQSVYRFPLFKFCVTLFNDPILCDTTPESNPIDPENMFTCISDVKFTNDHNTNTKWRRSSRALRHRKLLDVNLTSVDNVTLTSEGASFKDGNTSLLKPPKVALHFFEKYLPLDQKTDSDLVDTLSNGGCSAIEISHQSAEANQTLKDNFNNSDFSSDVTEYLIKANLWHSIWAHANTSHLASLPG